MRPYASDADESFRERVQTWARAEIAHLDEERVSDAGARELVARMGAGGLLEAVRPAEPGDDISALRLVIAREEIAYHSGLADGLYAMQGLGSYPLVLAGSREVKARWLPAVAAGHTLTGFAITEEGAGSDAARLETRAERSADGWVLNGEKRLISNAGIADLYTVFARSGGDDDLPLISAFVVEASAPGLEVTERTRLLACHPVGRLRFTDCRLPAAALLGEEGEGLRIAFRTLDTFRSTVAAAACGMARRALDAALDRVKKRHQFGKAVGDFQGTRFRLAEMVTRLEAARGLTYRAAWLRDRGEAPTLAASMAKLAATEWAHRIVDDALQLHGGDGLIKGAVVERLYRDVRALRIYEGTSEIQRLVIARELLHDRARPVEP